MKRTLVFLLALALLLTCACTATTADPADVSGDGRVTVIDAILTIRAMLGDASAVPDLNGDGKGTLLDVLRILKIAAASADPAFDALAGSGTATDPYRVASDSDLIFVQQQVLAYADTEGLYFKQTADIRLSATENWIPIGTGGIPFAGHYDGSGHKIEGLSIDTDESFQGLFGFITGSVENLDVYGSVRVHYDGTHSHSFAGGIVGAMNNGAAVRNCKSYVTIEGDAYVGGVVGAIVYTDDYVTDAFSVIENCDFYGTLTADDRSAINEDAMYFGGIAGRAYGAVKNCTNYGDINVTGAKTSYVGGITGYVYSPYKGHSPSAEQLPLLTLENCVNRGKVSGGRYVGGIAAQSSIPIKDCVNYGDVGGVQYIGGIAGVNGTSATYAEGYTVISDCTNSGTVTVSGQAGGGIAGYNFATVTACKNEGEVLGGSAATRIGGIAGYSRGSVRACENLASAKITGHQGLGGIIGYFNQAKATVADCNNYASVTSLTSAAASYHIGGIVGMLGSTNSILQCVNEGDVHGGGGSGTAGTGGIVGSLHSGSIVEECTNRGDVTANAYLGGIAGYGKMSAASYIRSSENHGDVSAAASGKVYLGGILGYAANGNIVKCTNYGNVQAASGAENVSATVGYASAKTVVTDVK